MAEPLQITVPAVGYEDPEVDDWIAAQLARQNAPVGSVQETINRGMATFSAGCWVGCLVRDRR